MYQSSLALRPSKLRQWAYHLAMAAIALVLLSVPLSGWLLLALAVLAFCSCYWLAELAKRPLHWTFLSLDPQGRFHAMPSMQRGQLLPQSLICEFGIWLFWQDEQGQTQQCWLYADHFQPADFRALARHCQLVKWQG
jgi:hypothetical protein